MIPKQVYLIITASLLILSIFTLQYIKTQRQETKIANLNTELAHSEMTVSKMQNSNEQMLRTINMQNEEMSKLSVDLDKARQSLDEWKRKPPEVRYEVIYKIREVKSNDCNTTKDVLNSIRNLDYSRL